MILTLSKLEQEVKKHTPSTRTRDILGILGSIVATISSLGYLVMMLFLVTYVLQKKFISIAIGVVALIVLCSVIYVMNLMAKEEEYYHSLKSHYKKLYVLSVVFTLIGVGLFILTKIL